MKVFDLPFRTQKPGPYRMVNCLRQEAPCQKNLFHRNRKNEIQVLGMAARITRRDFLNGIALTVGAAIVPPEMWAAAASDLEAQDIPGYYPPGKTGLRGSHRRVL